MPAVKPRPNEQDTFVAFETVSSAFTSVWSCTAILRHAARRMGHRQNGCAQAQTLRRMRRRSQGRSEQVRLLRGPLFRPQAVRLTTIHQSKTRPCLSLFIEMQNKQMQLHMSMMQEQMLMFMKSMSDSCQPPVVVTVPAPQPAAAAATAPARDAEQAAAEALGLDDIDMADPAMASWAEAFGSIKRSKPDSRDIVAMRLAGMEFKKKIHLLYNYESRVQKLKADCASNSEGRVPSGVKPFKTVFEPPT